MPLLMVMVACNRTHCSIHSIQSGSKAALAKAWRWELVCVDDVRVAVVQGNLLGTRGGTLKPHHTPCTIQHAVLGVIILLPV